MSSGQFVKKSEAPFRIIGKAKTSSWGKVGRESRISAIVPGHAPEACLAEYWLGAHDSMPSEVLIDAETRGPLNAFLKGNAVELLGSVAAERYSSELPFLLKVLSINEAHGLSIQAHPDAVRAKRLHALDSKNYPDARHKPEIGLPLSTVTLLYGFKPIGDLREVLNRLPMLGALFGGASFELAGRDLYRTVFSSLFALGPERTASLVAEIARETKHGKGKGLETEVFHRLREQYGDEDPGLIALFIMNVITIEPGRGIFIPANLPHAYLAGDLVECMACSDNVVRGGLTPKYKDVSTLLEMVTYDPVKPQPILPIQDEEGFLVFPTPCSEFEVGYVPAGRHVLKVSTDGGARLLMSLGASSVVTSLTSGRSVTLSDGDGALLPIGTGFYEVRTHDAAVYRASIGRE